jgi:hypothetical protein
MSCESSGTPDHIGAGGIRAMQRAMIHCRGGGKTMAEQNAQLIVTGFCSDLNR